MWIHSDVNTYKDIYEYEDIYSQYDLIYNASKEGKVRFMNKFPNLSYKIGTFYNLIDDDELNSLAINGDSFEDDFNGFRILTVGRLSIEKGQNLIPQILDKLIKSGKFVRWYCIGDGDLNNELKLKIQEYGLKENLILLGTKLNPYGYIKDCDIYVQPSLNECYCTTVTEAKCFNKPMVITDVNGSREQIENNHNGLIVDIDSDSILKGIIKLIEKDELRDKFINNLRRENISTINEVEKLYKLLE